MIGEDSLILILKQYYVPKQNLLSTLPEYSNPVLNPLDSRLL